MHSRVTLYSWGDRPGERITKDLEVGWEHLGKEFQEPRVLSVAGGPHGHIFCPPFRERQDPKRVRAGPLEAQALIRSHWLLLCLRVFYAQKVFTEH